jgi:hypothetical protein
MAQTTTGVRNRTAHAVSHDLIVDRLTAAGVL